MKKTILKFIAIIAITSLFTSCATDILNRVRGNGNVTIEKRKMPKFNGIKSSAGIDVYISEGSSKTITVTADENLQELITTEVKDGILIITSNRYIANATAKRVTISATSLDLLKATSGSHIYSEDTITTDEISITSTSGAFIKVAVNATSVETKSTSGSNLKITGKAVNHASSATSGSSIEAYDFICKNVLVSATSGADINVFASDKIEAKATSGGDIDYKGNPKRTDKKSSSGGSVSAK